MVICNDRFIIEEQSQNFQFTKLSNNILYEISDECVIQEVALQKRIEVSRQPKPGFSHIFEEEVMESIDAMSAVTDDGGKFISDH